MAKQITGEPLAVTPATAANLLGVSRPFVMKLVAAGKLMAKHEGKRWIIPYHSLKNYVEAPEGMSA